MAKGKKTGGKDFVKGDQRINRFGRPKKHYETLDEIITLKIKGFSLWICVEKLYDLALSGDLKSIEFVIFVEAGPPEGYTLHDSKYCRFNKYLTFFNS